MWTLRRSGTTLWSPTICLRNEHAGAPGKGHRGAACTTTSLEIENGAAEEERKLWRGEA